jgi:hypothetical protein
MAMADSHVRGWFSQDVRHRWTLILVAFVELALFCQYHHERWHKSLLTLGRPQASAGEGLVIRCDGLGYYAWLRSLLIDRDWSFDNEFDEHNVIGDFVPSAEVRTRAGRRPNPWSVGPACAWSLVVVPVHVAPTLLHSSQPLLAPNGYSLPYQLAVGFTTVGISWLGLLFLYGICRHYASPPRAALAAALLTLGTTILYYSAIEVSMAHGIGTAAVAGLVWYWLRTYGSTLARRASKGCSTQAWRWFIVGLLLGITALVRWQLLTLAVLPLGEAFLRKDKRGGMKDEKNERSSFRFILHPSSFILLGAFLAFLPQLVAWRSVYGQWTPLPIAVSHNWTHPAWWQILAAQDRGFFYWTPLTLVALLGYAAWLIPSLPFRAQLLQKHEGGSSFILHPSSFLLAAFLLQVYVLASMWGSGVYLGAAYGLRHLTESVVLLAPGLALLLGRASRPWFRVLCFLGCGLVLWNLLLMCQYRYGLLPADCGASPATMLANAVRLLQRKRLFFAGSVFVPLILLALSLRGQVEPERQRATAGPGQLDSPEKNQYDYIQAA